jgi:hypothetical protein
LKDNLKPVGEGGDKSGEGGDCLVVLQLPTTSDTLAASADWRLFLQLRKRGGQYFADFNIIKLKKKFALKKKSAECYKKIIEKIFL